MNKRHRRAAVATATGLCSLLVIVCAQAQIVADPNAPGRQRPTVLSAPNGVPLVNIQTPSAAGVSRNTYRQFDVNGQGAILNNSRTNVQTQLGGWVPGNPWLATGSARIILNEVNSTNPSYLNGPLEVAGQRAEVIIANPAGIQVNGGSFINASGITLTTGTPVMNEGSLESFRVRGGQVQVNGLGLDARGADHAAIFARAMEVNAAIWANQLNVVVGAGQTQAGTLQTTPLFPDPNAPKPTVLLDVAAIGGMYAGKIFLRGTEAGLGVNNRGTIASQGPLTLLPNGQLINHGRIYGQDIQIHNASEVRNQDGGVIAARESLSIDAAQIHNTEGGELLSLGKMALSASERLENRSARIEAQGDLSITTPVLINANDHFQTELVAEPGQRYLRLRHQGVDYKAEELGLNFDRLDQYHDKAEWQVLLPSGEYPFDQYPALAAQWGASQGGWSGSFQLEASRTEVPCPGSDCNPTYRDTYAPEHPIWQRLGVAPFGPPPEPPPLDHAEDPAWQQQMAQYQAHKRAQQDALDQKIGAYNASVAARTLTDWVVIDAQSTDFNPKVVNSAPGQIVSGGDMSLNTRTQLLNHNSEIVAGGALKVQGATLENRGSEVVARTELSGQAVYSWRREEGLFKNDDRLYEHSPYQAVQERGARVNVARSQRGTSHPAGNPQRPVPTQPRSPGQDPDRDRCAVHQPTPMARFGLPAPGPIGRTQQRSEAPGGWLLRAAPHPRASRPAHRPTLPGRPPGRRSAVPRTHERGADLCAGIPTAPGHCAECGADGRAHQRHRLAGGRGRHLARRTNREGARPTRLSRPTRRRSEPQRRTHRGQHGEDPDER